MKFQAKIWTFKKLVKNQPNDFSVVFKRKLKVKKIKNIISKNCYVLYVSNKENIG